MGGSVESDQKAPDESSRELYYSAEPTNEPYDGYYDDIMSTRYGSGVCLSGPNGNLPFWCRCRCECQCIEDFSGDNSCKPRYPWYNPGYYGGAFSVLGAIEGFSAMNRRYPDRMLTDEDETEEVCGSFFECVDA